MASRDRGRSAGTAVALGAGGLLVFLAEVAMFAGLYLAARASLGGGASGVAVGIAALAVGIAAWGLWMAPTSSRRIPAVPRAVAAAVAGAVIAGVLLVNDRTWFAAAVAAAALVYATGTLVAGERVPVIVGGGGGGRDETRDPAA
ncbi:MAG: DUF2568 domain-containing protein [Thermoleophilia bacterium]|nr:DUF2568 domain-containing protein [Thermoleophilia bacterium]